MSKTLDWSKVASTLGFDDKRRKAQGQDTYRERVQKSLASYEESMAAEEFRKSQEPLLKSVLLDHMVNRKPITVMKSIHNPTESLGGVVDNGEEDDGFYYNPGRGDKAQSTANAKFQEVMETIPAGTQLVFKSMDKVMGQWIFKGSNGREYAVYDKPTVMFQGQSIQNPGFFGLLYNTHLIHELGE